MTTRGGGKVLVKICFILLVILLFVNNKFVTIPGFSLLCLWWYLVSDPSLSLYQLMNLYIFSAHCSCRGKWQSSFCLVSRQSQCTTSGNLQIPLTRSSFGIDCLIEENVKTFFFIFILIVGATWTACKKL